MSENLETLFCRIGSKRKLINKILPLIPSHKIYVEPFIGSGAIYFASTTSGDKRIINDLDKQLIDAYKVVKKGVNIDSNYLDVSLNQQQQMFDKKILTDKDKLIKQLLVCGTFGSKGIGKLYKKPNYNNKLKKLEEYKNFMKNTTILNQDYKKVINTYDSKDTFFFLDPPYENSNDLYKHSDFNFEELRDILININGLFLLTLNDSPNIRKIFKDFIIKPILVKATSNIKNSIGSKDRKEIIIMNYTINK